MERSTRGVKWSFAHALRQEDIRLICGETSGSYVELAVSKIGRQICKFEQRLGMPHQIELFRSLREPVK